jgi:hypothetical protein
MHGGYYPQVIFFRVEHSKPRFQKLTFILVIFFVVDKMIPKGDNLACQF